VLPASAFGGRQAAPAQAMLGAAAIMHHARSDQPSGHTPDVPTGPAVRLTSRNGASNAGEWRPSRITDEAISRKGTQPPCRPARPRGKRAASPRTMLRGASHQASRTRRSAVKAHTRCADQLGWAAKSSTSASSAEGRRLPRGVTHEAISDQVTCLLRRSPRLGGRQAAIAQAMLNGRNNQASRTRRSAVTLRAG